MEALERYRELLQRADNAICLLSFPSLRFLDANPSACRLFGVTPNRQAEKCLTEAIDVHSAEAIDAWIRDPVLQADLPLRLESLIPAGGAGEVMVDLTLTLVEFRDDRYVVCVAQDITERKEAEKDLSRALEETETSRTKIDAILRSVADGLLVVGLDGRISLMNLCAESFLECSAAAACSRPYEETVHQENLQRQIRAVLDGEDRTMVLDFEISSHRKTPRTIRAKTTSVHGPENRRTGAITILQDITREKALDRMKDEFISTAAHELRTPLTSLMGYSEILHESSRYGGFSHEQQQDFLDIIHQKAEELSRIVDDLLDLSRVQSGKLIILDRTPGDLGSLLREIVQSCRERMTDHHFVLDLPELPFEMEFDKARITHLMQNLLSNAIKFSPRGSVIRISARREPHFCLVGVEDEGIGMSAEDLEHIFDKFYRADASNTGFAGLGLGMSIVRQIVEAHGGEIQVRSQPGSGTQVTFSLPLERRPQV
jgi:PAS domain S-box-containing protein